MAAGGSFRRGRPALSPRAMQSTTNSLGRSLRHEAHSLLPARWSWCRVVSDFAVRRTMARFHRASVWPRARSSARGPRWLARLRRAWERGNVRDLKIGPVIHPTSTRRWLNASPGRHSVVILGSGQRRFRDHTLDTPIFPHCALYAPSSSTVLRLAAEFRFESVVQQGLQVISRIFLQYKWTHRKQDMASRR
jgi:hypothetical protein